MYKASPDLVQQLQGYGRLTAEILYYYPDRPRILAPTLTLQMYDIAPKFPVLHEYIEFWKREIEGSLRAVRFAHQFLIGPSEWQHLDGEITIN